MPTLSRPQLRAALAFSFASLHCTGCDSAVAEDALPLPPTVVQATPPERSADTPSLESDLDAQTLEESGASDLKDALLRTLDISVSRAPNRYRNRRSSIGRGGTEGVNIRGLGGGRVLMLIDGVRLPEGLALGSFTTGRGDYVDMHSTQSMHIVRGPSTLEWGSDALAGAVLYRTPSPRDILKHAPPNSQSPGGYMRSAYTSVDQAWASQAAVAQRQGAWQWLLQAGQTLGREASNKGSIDTPDASRTLPNPASVRGSHALGKIEWMQSPAHHFGLTLETHARQLQTAVLSARDLAPLQPQSTLALDTTDTIDRSRASLVHRYTAPENPWFQTVRTQCDWQTAQVRQSATERIHDGTVLVQDNRYQTRLAGVRSTFENTPDTALEQRIQWGFHWRDTEVSGRQDSLHVSQTPANISRSTRKPFPDTQYRETGVFAQTAIDVGSVTVTPGLRYDHYALTPRSDGYAFATAALAGQAWTPRIRWVWAAHPAFAPYGQWASGYKPPTPYQVNNGYRNPRRGYVVTGNAALRAETARASELGLRGRRGPWEYALAVYENHYTDFIASRHVSGAGTPQDPAVYQQVNYGAARIKGWELRSAWQISPRWKAQAAHTRTFGTTTENGQTEALDSVQPAQWMLALHYDNAAWGGSVHWTHSAAKRPEETRPSPGAAPLFTPPGFHLLDLGAYWKPHKKFSLHANLRNVLDTHYWRWSDLAGLRTAAQGATPVPLDAYTAAGRTLQISARYNF